jgi:Tol biopolymer transport system component
MSAALVLAALAIAAGLWMNRESESPVTSPSDYVRLTDFPDSVVDPSLSPDGRMVTFIRADSEGFPRYGDVWFKLLPDGEVTQLTHSQSRKYAPTFTPDGSRIAYTQREANEGQGQASWDTWTVPISGGEPTRLLPNASGLLWIDDQHVLFAEIKTGLHMGIVTASIGRADKREIYFPDHGRAMAHYAHLSPDRRNLLIVEMDGSGAFIPCRLAPFDGDSPGRPVGPRGSCTAAAWSPDGRWMYFIAAVNDTPRLWRQRYPDGPPEQMTSGLTDEVGLAVARDGRSIVTAVGPQRSAVLIHSDGSDKQVTTEGVAFAPQLSLDGRRLYYLLRLLRPNALEVFTELRSHELSSGKTDRLLPDRSVTQYVVSRDEREVAFTATTPVGAREVWLAALDRSMPARRVVQSADDVSFGAGDDLIFRSLEDKENFLMRIGKDGGRPRRIIETPIFNKYGVSPNGGWAAVAATDASNTYVTLAVPLGGGEAFPICNGCAVHWSPDGTRLYVGTEGPASPSSLVVPIDATQAPPRTLMTIIAAARKGERPAGIELIERLQIAPGPSPSVYAFTRRDIQRNLFRIPIR